MTPGEQKRDSDRETEDALQRILDSVQGQNPLGDFRPRDLLDTAKMLALDAAMHPAALFKAYVGYIGELGKVLAGTSDRAPEPGDKRFADPAWKDAHGYKIWLQAYLALCDQLKNYAPSGLDAKQIDRARFLLSQIGAAVAPTNYLLGNPAALKRLIDSGGISLARGYSNLLGDVAKGRPLPSQVDDKPFKVGENLAATPGAIVLRTEMFELLQYAPQTKKVRQRPLLVVPSIINKYYVADLAPGRSLFEYMIKGGITLFTIIWRNPKADHDHWGIAAYQDAIDAAIDAVRDIGRAEDLNVWGVCGAGPLVVSILGYYAAIGQRKVHSLTLVVSPLDSASMSASPVLGGLMDPRLTKLTKRKKRISADEFTLLFAMLRPNDLIWNYWVNNYLMGNDPPAYDVLAWNADGTGMTAQYNKEFAEISDSGALTRPGAMTVRGVPISDLAELGIDSYCIGAATDHIVIWPAVYRSALLLGKRSEFVLSASGHVQTLVCPPGNPKSHFFINKSKPPTADEWLEGATKQQGTWWDHLLEWTTERAGPLVSAPHAAGDDRYRPLHKAPGTYVLEKA